MDKTSGILSIICLLASLSLVSCDVISMGTMIDWEDKKTSSIFQVMSRFNYYGCYCGFGGHGLPLDQIDCCCQIHDECYDKLAKDGTCESGHVGVGMVYKFTKINKNGKHTVQCDPSSDTCAKKICGCDKDLAECFSKNEDSYTSAHKSYDRAKRCDSRKKLRAGFCPNSNP